MESWPLDRSGFSAFVGDPISQPADRPRLERVLNYILRPSLPLKHLSYVESSGQVRYSPPRAASKVWEHAFDFLADWVQRSPSPPSSHLDLATDAFSDCDSQVPEGWDNWEAA